MPKEGRRRVREDEEIRGTRSRKEIDADAEKVQSAPEDTKLQKKLAQQSKINLEEENEWEDFTSEESELDENDVDERFDAVPQEEIIDEGDDDDEYAEFQKESAKEITKGIKSVSFEDEREGGAAAEDDAPTVWRSDKTGDLTKGERLEYSNKAYDSFFQLRTEYPALSFDILLNKEGNTTSKYPLSMTLVCGSQADAMDKNQLYVLNISNIGRTKHDVESDADSEDSYIGDGGESEEDDDADEEANNGEPIVHHRTVSHYGTANRIRCAPLHPNSNAHLLAVWSDAGHVQVFNLESHYRTLCDFSNWTKEQVKADKMGKKEQCLKYCTPSSTHSTEGYGLDWSSVSPNVFASGDCSGSLFVWQPTEDGRWKNSASNIPKSGMSIEEIQWSPIQSEVLIAARAGGTVEVWDTRDMRQSKVQWQADATDINVADWNRAKQASHLLVTGADSGNVAIWDLRKLSIPEPIQKLSWHKGSITSVEFSVHNESVLSVTGDDGQCTLWDLSLERDPSEEQEVIGELFGRTDLSDIPDQLMFQHQGLEHPKEAHWHPQIPGMLVTTDYEGLHLFRPMNWRSLMK